MNGRREPRYAAELAVQLENGAGIARNVSPSGIYFETDVALEAGSDVSFVVDFDLPEGGALKMKCKARVVRIVPLAKVFGVGARIHDFSFERTSIRKEIT